jgi:hypothetical protein
VPASAPQPVNADSTTETLIRHADIAMYQRAITDAWTAPPSFSFDRIINLLLAMRRPPGQVSGSASNPMRRDGVEYYTLAAA